MPESNLSWSGAIILNIISILKHLTGMFRRLFSAYLCMFPDTGRRHVKTWLDLTTAPVTGASWHWWSWKLSFQKLRESSFLIFWKGMARKFSVSLYGYLFAHLDHCQVLSNTNSTFVGSISPSYCDHHCRNGCWQGAPLNTSFHCMHPELNEVIHYVSTFGSVWCFFGDDVQKKEFIDVRDY